MIQRPTCTLLSSLVLLGCSRGYTPQVSTRLLLDRAAPTVATGPCTPRGLLPERSVTEAPLRIEGRLTRVDVRAAPGLRVGAPFQTQFSQDGELLYIASASRLLAYRMATGAIEFDALYDEPIERPMRLVVGPGAGVFVVAGRAHARPGRGDTSVVLVLVRSGATARVSRIETGTTDLAASLDRAVAMVGAHRIDLASGAHAEGTFVISRDDVLLDARRVLSCRAEGAQRCTPRVRDVALDSTLHAFEPVEAWVRPALSADGRRVAFGHRGGRVDVYDLARFTRVASIESGVPSPLTALSPDGSRLLVESMTCAMVLDSRASEARCPPPSTTLWDVARALVLVRTPRSTGDSWFFSGDGRYLTGDEHRLVPAILRADTLEPLRFGERIYSVSPDGRYVSFESNRFLSVAPLDGAGEALTPGLVSLAPEPLLASSIDGARTVWREPGGSLRIEGPERCVRVALGARTLDDATGLERVEATRDTVQFSRDGSLVYVLRPDGYGAFGFRALDAVTGALRWSLTAAHPSRAAVGLAHDALVLQGRGRDEVLRYDARTGALRVAGRPARLAYATASSGATIEHRDPSGDRVQDLVAPTPLHDESLVATCGHFDERLWLSVLNLRDPSRVIDLPSRSYCLRVASDPTRDTLAVGDAEGRVRIFRRGLPGPIDAPTRHRARVSQLAFSPDGALVLSIGEDGGLALSDARNGDLVGRVSLTDDPITFAWISPDGSLLRVQSASGMLAAIRVAAREDER